MFKRNLVFFIALIVFIGAIALSVPNWGEVRDVATGNYRDLNEYLAESGDGLLPDKYVTVTINSNIGCFASRDANEDNEAEYFYVAWLDDNSFIPVKVKDDAYDLMEKMSEKTWDYVDGKISEDEYDAEPYTFIASINEMEDDAARFYRSYIAECGIDESTHVVRYQELRRAYPSVPIVIIDRFLFHILAAIVALLVMIGFGKRMMLQRKSMSSFESSVQEYNPADKVKRLPVVSAKQAVMRIANPVFANYHKGNKKTLLICLIIIFLGVFIPADLYAYSKFYKPGGDAGVVYDMDNPEEFAKAKNKSVGELKTEYLPVIVRSTGSSTGDYIVYGESTGYIAELDDGEYSKALKDIREKGFTILHGYYSKASDETAKYAIEYINDYFGENYAESEFNNVFGNHSLVVEESYKGGGVTESTVKTITVITLIVAALALIVLIGTIISVKDFKKELSYFTDAEYFVIESELASPQTYKGSDSIYCTDRHIVALGGKRMIIPYSDILWAYLKINYTNGTETNYEIVVLDKEKGAYNLPAFKRGNENKQIIGNILEKIKTKNPNARIGYTQENIRAAAKVTV
ncbi:hypothetical protein D6853_10320 [Butyrivibrio sp. X503]|uniref:DUF6709 family protein n=1 Tax=Butyrivibrio sp. X503 TaxID=2364878 RepID=UPI000EAA139E|nr:DUF6709 family protein [Butyrivibrio sp. X503]RKM55124.1 hypothetical protein D6853_10320 [Butyrivibrio sp. X503]